MFYNSASIYFGVLFLCVQGLAIYLYSPAEILHQVVLVLELEEGRKLLFVQVLRMTGLTSHPNRSDRLVELFGFLIVRSVRAVCLTGLTGQCADKPVLSCNLQNLLKRLFTPPPLGDIQVLSH